MMRTIAAILALSPAMLLAQAAAPAQPSSTPVLVSNLLSPAEPAAGDRADNHTHRVSTYTPPKRIHSVEANLDGAFFRRPFVGDRTVVLQMTIDATGKPADVTVAHSAGRPTDDAVVAAVSQYRYQPAMLNGRAVPAPVKLNYEIQQWGSN